MNRLTWFIGLVILSVLLGCNSDIVCTKDLKLLENKCVHIEPLASDNPQIGKVIRDVIEKEFVRRNVQICDPNTATILIGGATFLTVRSTSSEALFMGSSDSRQAIESVSLVAKDPNGQILLSASYDNQDRLSATKLASEFGSELAGKLR
ncbi:MAG: hypothetical protein JSV82_04710 [Planctomycetota bacterium]|nr:MAG: hypothetical protein JSV82_04710 [Planctomycetota bacterium]